MAVASAQKFIHHAITDSGLVQRINSAADCRAVQDILTGLDYGFNHEEFEQAYFNVLTDCQTYGQAEVVKGIKLWWDCLGYSFSPIEKTNNV